MISLPLPSPPLLLSSSLDVGPLNPTMGLKKRYKLPSRVWDRAPVKIEFGAFQP